MLHRFTGLLTLFLSSALAGSPEYEKPAEFPGDKLYNPALYSAVIHGDAKAVEDALAAGSDPSQGLRDEDLDLFSRPLSGPSHPIHLTATIEGADESSALEHSGVTPLFAAAALEDTKITRLLLRYGANPLQRLRSGRYQNLNPLLIAIRKRHHEIISLLHSNRPDAPPDTEGGDQFTADLTAEQMARIFWRDGTARFIRRSRKRKRPSNPRVTGSKETPGTTTRALKKIRVSSLSEVSRELSIEEGRIEGEMSPKLPIRFLNKKLRKSFRINCARARILEQLGKGF